MFGSAIRGRRRAAAWRWLRGAGVEIGALHNPMPTPPGVAVRYVDRAALPELRAQYRELDGLELTAPDVVDDGETLGRIEDGSLDFIVACHFIEHCQDPLTTIENHLAKLRDGGVLYYTVPNKGFTFDRRRPVTSAEHVLRDRRQGPEGSRTGHYLEQARLVEGAPDAESHAARLEAAGYSVHFHVWDFAGFREFLEVARQEVGGFRVVEYAFNYSEIIAVLQKGQGADAAGTRTSWPERLAIRTLELLAASGLAETARALLGRLKRRGG